MALNHIQKLIPYPILFVLRFQEDFLYAIFYKNNFFYLDWNKKIEIDLNVNDLQNLYENIVKYFFNIKKDDFQVSIELQNRIKTIEKEINALKNKIKK